MTKPKDSPLVQFLLITQVVLIVTVAYLFATRNSSVSTPTPIALPSTTPTPTLTITKGWHLFTDETNKYTILYPEKWFNLPSLSNQPDQRYFSNEDIGAPLELSTKGIWVTITTHKGSSAAKFTPIFKANKGLIKDIKDLQVTKLQDLDINGLTAVKYSTLPNSEFRGDGGYILEYAIKSGDNVFEISFFTPLDSFAKQNEVLYSQIANSFKLL